MRRPGPLHRETDTLEGRFLQFLQGLFSKFCTLSSHCQCFAHSFIFASQRSQSLASSSSFFRICAPPFHVVGFVNLCRSPALPFHFLQPNILLLHGFLFSWMEPRFLTICRQQLSNQHRFLASILPFDLIFFVISFITFICCCSFISYSVESSCMLCRRCRLYSLNKAKVLAQQSSHHFRILYFLLLRTRLPSKKEPLPL